MTPLLCACAVVITFETQKCRKKAPCSVEIHLFAGRAVKRERRKGSSRRQQTAYGAVDNEVARELLHSARCRREKMAAEGTSSTTGRSLLQSILEGGVEKKIAPTATKKKGGRKRQCPALCEVCLRPSSPALLPAFSHQGPSNDCPCACFARFWLPDGCPRTFQAGPVTWKRTV